MEQVVGAGSWTADSDGCALNVIVADAGSEPASSDVTCPGMSFRAGL
jgi:hypothetical protein